MLKLGNLPATPGARRRRRRVGRGEGSGRGKTAGRGSKGQQARNTVRRGFEGGQTPLYRRLPRFRGFKSPNPKVFAIINVGDLARFEAGAEVTPELLLESGVISRLRSGVKVLGDGELPHALTIRAHRFSKQARAKLEAGGATVEVIE